MSEVPIFPAGYFGLATIVFLTVTLRNSRDLCSCCSVYRARTLIVEANAIGVSPSHQDLHRCTGIQGSLPCITIRGQAIDDALYDIVRVQRLGILQENVERLRDGRHQVQIQHT